MDKDNCTEKLIKLCTTIVEAASRISASTEEKMIVEVVRAMFKRAQ